MRISDWSSDVCSSDLRGASPSRPASSSAVAGPASWSDPNSPSRCPIRTVGTLYAPPRSASILPTSWLSLSPSSSAIHGLHRIASATTRRRSEEHTSELQSLLRISYAVFCLKKKQYHTQYI